MRYSPEALTAFVETVAAGSFSAAARRLRKSQSTISTSIANLEADLGFDLFDRSARQPVLTVQGEQVLGYVQSILAASARLACRGCLVVTARVRPCSCTHSSAGVPSATRAPRSRIASRWQRSASSM